MTRRRLGIGVLVAVLLIAGAIVYNGRHGGGLTKPSGAGPFGPTQPVGEPRANDQRPNIVFIMTDDQELNTLQYMPKTQALLTRQGVLFKDSQVSFPLCCPSRATALTGQYAHNHGVLSNSAPQGGWQKFNANGTEAKALPVAMQRAGYNTMFVGKYLNGWGIGRDHAGARPQPVPPGWSSFIGLVGLSEYSMWGYTLDDNGVQKRYPGNPSDAAAYQTDVLRGQAAQQIRSYAQSSRPFMQYIFTVAPHTEENASIKRGLIRPAPRYASALPNLQLHRTPSFNEADVSKKPPYIRQRPLLTSQNIADMTLRYRARVRSLLSVDDLVAKVVETLRQTGRLNNTVIAYTGDEVWLFGQHRIFNGKIVPYGDSARVPLIFRGPGIQRGASSNAVAANIDLAPTFLDLAHAKSIVEPDGISLAPLLTGRARSTRRDLLLEDLEKGPVGAQEGSGGGKDEPYRALRTSRWLYVVYTDPKQGIELYDLRKDPDNLTNLAPDPRYAGVVAGLGRRLDAIKACAGAACRRGRAAY